MNEIANNYIKLCFQVGKYDKDYVDAYFGPEKLRKEAEAESKRPELIKQEAESLMADMEKISLGNAVELTRRRHKNLLRLIQALHARVEFLSGKKMTFDEESKAFYDAVSPSFPSEHFDEVLKQLDELLPGKEPLGQRVDEFRKQFFIPPDKLAAVFEAAIAEGRKRTKAKIQLPENESFELEYVSGKPWGAYNWFKGNAKSLIQVNTDLPLAIDRAIDLACHEGYPGHHVYSTLIEQKLYKEKGWVEYSINPLFSPIALIMEGTANFGIEVAFTPEERLKFEKEVLFPLAGLDPAKVELYYKVQKLTSKLSFARNDVTRLYLDGKITEDEAADRLSKYQLRNREFAKKSLAFVNKYRSYIINYNLGLKMVRDYMEKRGATADNPQKRWNEFIKLLSSPTLPSDLK
ncbi:MAG: hypothetical protein GY950_27135 [bacterium]|nr:hypothetical protein [bacterium]